MGMENICHQDEKGDGFLQVFSLCGEYRLASETFGSPSIEAGGSSLGSMGKELVLGGG